MLDQKVISVDNLPVEIQKGRVYSIQQSNPNTYTHGMFKYPCKFIPELPRWGMTKYLTNNNQLVFDPFSGSGTTLLEANINGFDAYGTEIDDVAKLIIKVKTTPLSKEELQELNNIYKTIVECIDDERCEVYTPGINNLEHWFSEDALNKLGRLRTAIFEIENENIRDFFKVCFAAIIKKVSNADDTSPKPYVSTKVIKVPPLVESEFANVYKKYYTMIKEYAFHNYKGHTVLLHGDAKCFEISKQIDLAITSPPYINAFDYGRTMRLENLWLDTLTEDDLRNKKKAYVGTEKININTEKCNTEILADSMLLKQYYQKLLLLDEKRALIVKRFFEDMKTNLISVYNALKPDGKYMIVIGNSSIRNVDIESWRVIEEIAHSIGYCTHDYFSYMIQNPYIRIPRNGKGGKISVDYVIVLGKGN